MNREPADTVPYTPRDAMNHQTSHSFDDYAKRDDFDPDEDVPEDEYAEDAGFFPSLFERR